MKRIVLNYVTLCAVLAASFNSTASAEPGPDILARTGVTGGLVVHLGCGTGELCASLRVNDSIIVHGLDRKASAVEQARAHVTAQGLAGKVAVSRLYGDRLPFIDNLVNLVVVEPDCDIAQAEIMRVLSPGGTAYFRQRPRSKTVVKALSPELDEWTHYLYDASNNAVSQDKLVAQPRHMQFRTDLEWSRNHDKQASVSGVVTTQGRIFYVMDSGPGADMSVPSRWWIVARDAYNGIFLWKRSIGSWTDHLRGFRSGPVQLPRLLVARGDRVYVPLSVQEPLVALDAASGKTVRSYKGTAGTEEIVLLGQTLLVVTGTPVPTQAYRRLADVPKTTTKQLMAFHSDTGELLWQTQDLDPESFVACTLAANDGCVYYRYGASVKCLDRKTGREIWNNPKVVKPVAPRRNPGKGKAKRITPNSDTGTSTLVVKDDVLVLSDGRNVTALSTIDGRILWTTQGKLGFRSPQDVLVIGDTVWLGIEFTQGLDLRTGKVVRENSLMQAIQTAGHHHRCYRNKATERYIIAGYRGIEFLDLTGDEHGRNNWVRGLCQYGVMPANGLVYAPPHSCGCYMEAKLYGFWALAPESRIVKSETRRVKANNRLVKGPAYGKLHPSPLTLHPSSEWPTLRGDGRRSGVTPMSLPTKLRPAWQVKLSQDLTAPVAAAGMILVADTDAHRVYAIDARQGQTRWSYSTGARIDSPPTIYADTAVFGCRDGWVYCLRVTDGALAWRFRAAPADLRTVDRDQVESLWPVYGSVLVQDGKVYCGAGRNSYLDGGLFLFALDVRTGKVIHHRRIQSETPEILDEATIDKLKAQYPAKNISQNTVDYRSFVSADRSDGFSMAGALNDVITGDGTRVYLRHLTCNEDWQEAASPVPHLFSTSSFVDDNENHRSHMTIGLGYFARTIYAYPWIPKRFGPKLNYPMGLVLAYQGDTAWGIQRGSDYVYTLFQKEIPGYAADDPAYKNDLIRTGGNWAWSVQPGMRPRAMIKAGDRIYIGGMPVRQADDPYATFEGRGGGLVQVRSACNGELVNTIKLDSPVVWDGLAAAQGRLYVTCQDGRLVCMQ